MPGKLPYFPLTPPHVCHDAFRAVFCVQDTKIGKLARANRKAFYPTRIFTLSADGIGKQESAVCLDTCGDLDFFKKELARIRKMPHVRRSNVGEHGKIRGKRP